MATTTASKGGLRATATAKRTKAAQRTPLPPKPGAVAAARAEVPEVAPRKQADVKTKPRKTGGVLAEARRAKNEVPAEPKDKGAKYAALLLQAGWKPGVDRKDGMVELVATRGVEALYLSWLNEAHISGGSTYTYADRTIKVRNPAEAMRIAGRKPEEAQSAQAKVSNNKQFRKRPTGPTVRNVPFDINSATDEEIAQALAGHQIAWHNQYRSESETATVGSLRSVRVNVHPLGHRIVSFVDPEFGFRAFRLDLLENVGRQMNLERIRQQILASLSNNKGKGKAA